jgi:hypothetical protein
VAVVSDPAPDANLSLMTALTIKPKIAAYNYPSALSMF